MAAEEKVIEMKTGSSTMWIVLLAVVLLLAVFSGMWVIDVALKVVLYVILAAVAIWAVMMLMKATKHGSHGHI